MVVISKQFNFMGMDIRGKLGAQGDPDPENVHGIYQVRTRYKQRVNVKEKFYTPTNPQTAPQQANRQKYANSIIAWRALTNSEKQMYNKRAEGKQMSGYNLFQRGYMLS